MKILTTSILLILFSSMSFAEEDLECNDTNKINMLINRGIMTKESCFTISGNELSLKILGQTYQLADIDPMGDNSVKEYESLCSTETITNNLSLVANYSKEKKLSDLSQAEASFMRFGKFVQALKVEVDKISKLTDFEGSKKISMESTGYADGVRVFVGSARGYKLDAGIYQWLKELKSSGDKDEFDHVYIDPEKFKIAACNILNLDAIKSHPLFKDDTELQGLYNSSDLQFYIQKNYLDSPRNYFIAYNRAKNLSSFVSQYIGVENIEKNDIRGKISKSLQTGRNMCRGYCTMRRGAKLKMTLPGKQGQITNYLPQKAEANPVYNSPLSGDHAVMDRIAVQTLVNDFSNYLIAQKNTPEVMSARNFFKRFVNIKRGKINFLLRNSKKNIKADSIKFKRMMVGQDKDGNYDSSMKKKEVDIYNELYIANIEEEAFQAEIDNVNKQLKSFLISKNGDLAKNLFTGADYDGSLPEEASFFNATKRIFWQNIYDIDYELGVPKVKLFGYGRTRVPKSGQEDASNTRYNLKFLGHAPSEGSDEDFLLNYFSNYDLKRNPKSLANKWKGFLINKEVLRAAINDYTVGSSIKIGTIPDNTAPIDYVLTDEDAGMLNIIRSSLDVGAEGSESVNLITSFKGLFATDLVRKNRPYVTRVNNADSYNSEGSRNHTVYFNLMYPSLHVSGFEFEEIRPTLMRILGVILDKESAKFIQHDGVIESHQAQTSSFLDLTQFMRGLMKSMRGLAKTKALKSRDIANSYFYKSPFKSNNGISNQASTIFSLLDYRNAYAKMLNDNYDEKVTNKNRLFPARPDDFLKHAYGIKHNPSKFGQIVESQLLPIKDYVNLTKIYFRPGQFYSRNKMLTDDSNKRYYTYRHYHTDGTSGRLPNKYDRIKNDFEAVGVFHPLTGGGCNTGTFFYNITDLDLKFLNGGLTETVPVTSPYAANYKSLDNTKFHYFSRMQVADHSLLPEGTVNKRSAIIQSWDKSFDAVDDLFSTPKLNLIKAKHPITYVIPNCGQCNCLKKGITGDKLEQILNGSLELNFYSQYKWLVENPDAEHPEAIALKEFVATKDFEWQKTFSDIIAKQKSKVKLPLTGKDICLYSPLIPQSHNAGSGGGAGNKTEHNESTAETAKFCPIIDALKIMPAVSGITDTDIAEVKRVCFKEVASFPMSAISCVKKQQDVCTFLPDKYKDTYKIGSAKCMHKALNINVTDEASFKQWLKNNKVTDSDPKSSMEGNLCKLLTSKFDKNGNPQ